MAESYEVSDDEPLSVAELDRLMTEGAIARARLVNQAAGMGLTLAEMFAQGAVTSRQRSDEELREELAMTDAAKRYGVGAQAIQCLEDAVTCMRAGDEAEALRILFIWQQRRHDILAGREAWLQNYSGERRPRVQHHMRGHFARPVVDVALHEAFAEGAGAARAVPASRPDDDDEIVDAELLDE